MAMVTQLFAGMGTASKQEGGGVEHATQVKKKTSSVIRPLRIAVQPAQVTKSRAGQLSGPAASHAYVVDARPLEPNAALKRYGRVLTSFEKTEILAYPEVHFVGPTAQKVRAAQKNGGANYGYDNENGRYIVAKNDHIAYRYEVLSTLGHGSFGDVVKVYDHKKRCHVALKIIRNEQRFHDQAKEEIKILEHLRTKDRADKHNVIHMLDHFVFRNHLCITFELLASDLYRELKRGGFAGLVSGRVRDAAAQLVTCLRNLRRSRIIHCDLKPENIVLRESGSSKLKVIDFGSSCFQQERVHTYIQSRFYRAPEIVLGGEYGTPIDMWSLGCLLVELSTGRPLFPAHSEKELIAMQVEYLGLPPTAVIRDGNRAHRYFTADGHLRQVTDRKGRPRGVTNRSLLQLLGSDRNQLVDFVGRCLVWDPLMRMTPREASRHPYITGRFAAQPQLVRGTTCHSVANEATPSPPRRASAGAVLPAVSCPAAPSKTLSDSHIIGHAAHSNSSRCPEIKRGTDQQNINRSLKVVFEQQNFSNI